MRKIDKLINIIEVNNFKEVDNYSRIYNDYQEIKKDFTDFVNKDKEKIDSKTMTQKYLKIIDFYIENKDYFKDDTYRVLELYSYDTSDGAVMGMVVDIVDTIIRERNKIKAKAGELIKNAVEDKVNPHKKSFFNIKFIKGTETFSVEYEEYLMSIKDEKLVDSMKKIMTVEELKKFITDKFSKIKSVGYVYA